MTSAVTVGLLGYGEVGQILGADLAAERILAFDLKFADAASGPSQAVAPPVAAASHAAALGACDVVVSAVTAAQTLAAAHSVAEGATTMTWYVDLNSASPDAKREAAAAIEAAGGRYVEAAVMSPVPSRRLATPMLLGGPHAEAFAPVFADLGFTGARVYSPELGKASAAKMCRSIMVKGVEALLSEALITARRNGVESDVLASLSDLFPGPDWVALAPYMIRRTLEHGARRAEEMREAARTVAEAGLSPDMSRAIAARQDWAARRADARAAPTLDALLDELVRTLDADAATNAQEIAE